MRGRDPNRFKDSISRLVRTNVFRASFLRVLAMALGIGTSVLLARLGGPEVKGVASAFAAASVLAYTLVAFDLPQQVLREARDRHDLGIVLGLIIRSWPYYVLLGSVATLGWWIVAGGSEIWLLIGAMGYLTSAQVGVGANGVNGPTATAIAAILQQAGMATLTIATHLSVGLNDDSVRGVVAASYFTSVPYLIWQLRRTNGHILGAERLPPRSMLSLIRRGLLWQPTRAAQFLLLRLDTLVTYAVLGGVATGVYSVGLATAALAGVVPAQFAANTTYIATSGGPSGLRRNLLGAMSTGTLMAAALASIGWLLVPALYGKEFSNAYWVQLLASPGIIAYGGLQVLTNQLRITGRPALLAIPSFIGVGSMSLFMFLTVSDWEIYGIAASSSLGACSALGTSYVMLRRASRNVR